MNGGAFQARDVAGFSLIEVAVVMVVMTILLAAVALPLATQLDAQRAESTRRQIDAVREALTGFAIANGRLPCPASDVSDGRESFCTSGTGACGAASTAVQSHGRCTHPFNGYVPGVTLGLSPLDAKGYVVDAWSASAANRLRYAVSTDFDGTQYVVTRPAGMKTRTMPAIAASSAHLLVCANGQSGPPSPSGCGSAGKLAEAAAAVVFSLGGNATAAPASLSPDEQNNQSLPPDKTFTAGEKNAAFDDVVAWISFHTLFARMVQAGALP